MPLTDRQRDHLQRRLLEERERLVGALGRIDRRLALTEEEQDGDLTTLPFHPADLGTDAIAREIDAQEETRIGREIGEINDALERLYQAPERFGRDERTGEEIPFERLDVIPWARRLVADAP